MDAQTFINNFESAGDFTEEGIIAVKEDRILRESLVNHFKHNHNRSFALALLNTLIELRKDDNNDISIDDLMLACFLLGMHGQIEDCLKVYEVKRIDFDTYCAVDMELVLFAGIDKTIAFLKIQNSKEAGDALEHVIACWKAGDYNNLQAYYNETPWWV